VTIREALRASSIVAARCSMSPAHRRLAQVAVELRDWLPNRHGNGARAGGADRTRTHAGFRRGKFDGTEVDQHRRKRWDPTSERNHHGAQSRRHVRCPRLYQLRGRIGSGKERALPIFTCRRQGLNEAASRAEVWQTSTLGEGSSSASHDLGHPRAATLGEEQSGHSREVGIETLTAAHGGGGGKRRGGPRGRAQQTGRPPLNLGITG